MKTWYIEGEPSWEGLGDRQRPLFEATGLRSRGIIAAEKEDAPYKLYKNQVGTASIDVHTPSFSIFHYFGSLLQVPIHILFEPECRDVTVIVIVEDKIQVRESATSLRATMSIFDSILSDMLRL